MLTWNLRHLRDDRAAVVRVLRAAAPDLVCVQEAPRLPSSRLRLRARAADSGLRYLAGGRSGAGTAMLGSPRLQARDLLAFRFPRRCGPRRRNSPAGRLPPQRRGAVLATVSAPGGQPIRVACVHLGLDGAERVEHASRLVEILPAAGLPVVVAGDLNEPPGGPSWRTFAALARDPSPGAPVTFSLAAPRVRIDAILTATGIVAIEYARWAPDPNDARRASDHFPVLAVIRPQPS